MYNGIWPLLRPVVCFIQQVVHVWQAGGDHRYCRSDTWSRWVRDRPCYTLSRHWEGVLTLVAQHLTSGQCRLQSQDPQWLPSGVFWICVVSPWNPAYLPLLSSWRSQELWWWKTGLKCLLARLQLWYQTAPSLFIRCHDSHFGVQIHRLNRSEQVRWYSIQLQDMHHLRFV